MTAPFSNTPSRISGPLVSSMVPMGRPSSSRRRSTIRNFSRCSSWVPWEKLNRATSIPASIIRRRVASSELDGPSVQIIFVLRIKPFTTPFSTPLLQFCFHCIAAAWKLQRKMRLGCKTRSPFIKCRSLPILLHLFRSLFGPRGFLAPSPLTNAPGCIMLTVLAILVH